MAQIYMRRFLSVIVKGVAASLSAYLLGLALSGGPSNGFQFAALLLSSVSLPTLLVFIAYEHLDKQGEITNTSFMVYLYSVGVTTGFFAYTAIVASANEVAGIVFMFSFILALFPGIFFIKNPNKQVQPNTDASVD